MQIIGFGFEKINAEKKEAMKEKVQINSNVNLKDITPEKINLIKDQAAVKFSFEFSVKHNPNVAEISLSGYVLALLDKDQAKEAFKKWKNKKITDDIRIPLFNFILTKCNLKALQFEEDFGLPTHIPFPRIQSQQEQEQNKQNYTG